MIKKLLPVLLALIGLGGGVGAGLAFKPDPVEMVEVNPCGEAGGDMVKMAELPKTEERSEEATDNEFVKLNNQFVVPIVTDELIDALVVMSLSVEIETGYTETVYTREPKLRDAFLQVLFDHANIGGFEGEFTNANNLDVLRMTLSEVARDVIGPTVQGVLITDIARQDI